MFKFNEKDIQLAAYYIWKNNGCPANTSSQDWNNAISQLSALASMKNNNSKSSLSSSSSKKNSSSSKTSACKTISASLKKTSSLKTVSKSSNSTAKKSSKNPNNLRCIKKTVSQRDTVFLCFTNCFYMTGVLKPALAAKRSFGGFVSEHL